MQDNYDEFRGKQSWQIIYPKEKTLELRKKYIGSSTQLFFADDPIKIIRGEKQYMFDENNIKYLDCINNVAHVGHSHPHVTAACAHQMSLLSTNSRYLHDNILQLAERIKNTLPESLEVFYFVNSGSEANDLAMRIGRYYTRSKETLVLEHAYHGHLISTTEISPYKLNRVNCEETKPDWCHVVPTPDRYRGKYKDINYDEEELANLYAAEVEKTCLKIESLGKSVGMFYLEALQSCGGQVIFPKHYLKMVCDIMHKHGGILIADEVQTGFGRVGETFWAFQLGTRDVVPDVVIMGKSMGNGHPLSALVTNRKLSDAFRRGPDYFNTFAGNPVSCAVGLAVLDVIESEGLQGNAKKIGDFLLNKFSTMKDDLPVIGDVRGSGMFLGIDLVTDRKTRAPATHEAKSVLKKLRQRHIIMSTDGPFDNILKFKPPMCFNEDDANNLVNNLKSVLIEVQDEMVDFKV